MASSPALVICFGSETSAAARDRLVALLAEHDLIAIHEDQINEPHAWTAHFMEAASRDAAASAIASDPEFQALETRPIHVEDEDWARRTQADLPAITIGRVTVAPPWDLPRDDERPEPDRAVLVMIEPSKGFGTGHHQSTRLCIALLQARDVKERTVVDIGTGSGVLAITAAKLGAAFVSAIDSDPDAVENARENIVANHVEKIVVAHVDDVATTTTPAADLVLANLTGSLLSRHAADLARLVRPNGSLIVSGFNEDERPRVIEAASRYFQISEEAEEDDWHAFVLSPTRS